MTSAFCWYLSWARRVRVAPARAVTDRQTDRHTHTIYEYYNLAPAWARLTTFTNPNNNTPVGTSSSEERYFTDPEVLNRTPYTFLVLGGSYAVLQLLGSVLLTDPPEHYLHENLAEDISKEKEGTKIREVPYGGDDHGCTHFSGACMTKIPTSSPVATLARKEESYPLIRDSLEDNQMILETQQGPIIILTINVRHFLAFNLSKY